MISLAQPEKWDLSSAAIVDERGRITLKKELLDVAKLKDGDVIFYTVTAISRKGDSI